MRKETDEYYKPIELEPQKLLSDSLLKRAIIIIRPTRNNGLRGVVKLKNPIDIINGYVSIQKNGGEKETIKGYNGNRHCIDEIISFNTNDYLKIFNYDERHRRIYCKSDEAFFMDGKKTDDLYVDTHDYAMAMEDVMPANPHEIIRENRGELKKSLKLLKLANASIKDIKIIEERPECFAAAKFETFDYINRSSKNDYFGYDNQYLVWKISYGTGMTNNNPYLIKQLPDWHYPVTSIDSLKKWEGVIDQQAYATASEILNQKEAL